MVILQYHAHIHFVEIIEIKVCRYIYIIVFESKQWIYNITIAFSSKSLLVNALFYKKSAIEQFVLRNLSILYLDAVQKLTMQFYMYKYIIEDVKETKFLKLFKNNN